MIRNLEMMRPTVRLPSIASLRRALRLSTLLPSIALLGVALLFTNSAKADTLVGSFSFTGAIDSENFYGTYPPFLTNDGVQVGDQIGVSFDLYSAPGDTTNGILWTDAARNIVVTDLTRGTTIAEVSETDFITSPGFPPEYRWDTAIPGEGTFEMTFWFRTTESGIVSQELPTTIDASQFNYLHDFTIYDDNGQNATVLDAPLTNAISPTPEPSSLALLTTGLFALAYVGRRTSKLTANSQALP